ncbi:hypothetical protein [Deinococcus ruber]|uniref:Lipoprotein n=1 Tax=Deinococcus ruber TaxID=1848197 RepID=A0A918F3W1_9DEIO|nr:hypothetical protein [Deinococcus ruber]GGQ99098.1 hypothetical protein GCM10008957_09600 [Deinococcus ruber]
MMKPRSLSLLALPLLAALSGCGTGLIPPITRDFDAVTFTFPAPTVQNPVVFYSTTNQLGSLPAISSLISSVEIAGNATYTGFGNLAKIQVYIRQNLSGCTIQTDQSYVACPADESANLVQTIDLVKGQPAAFKLSGTILTKAVQNKLGYLGVQVTGGGALQGDKLLIDSGKVTVRF